MFLSIPPLVSVVTGAYDPAQELNFFLFSFVSFCHSVDLFSCGRVLFFLDV